MSIKKYKARSTHKYLNKTTCIVN